MKKKPRLDSLENHRKQALQGIYVGPPLLLAIYLAYRFLAWLNFTVPVWLISIPCVFVIFSWVSDIVTFFVLNKKMDKQNKN